MDEGEKEEELKEEHEEEAAASQSPDTDRPKKWSLVLVWQRLIPNGIFCSVSFPGLRLGRDLRGGEVPCWVGWGGAGVL